MGLATARQGEPPGLHEMQRQRNAEDRGMPCRREGQSPLAINRARTALGLAKHDIRRGRVYGNAGRAKPVGSRIKAAGTRQRDDQTAGAWWRSHDAPEPSAGGALRIRDRYRMAKTRKGLVA